MNNNRKNTNNNHIPYYQVDKLRSRLSERIGGYGSASNKKASTNVFKHNDKWYKISMRVDEMTVDYPESQAS
jgi:hypothetical protein